VKIRFKFNTWETGGWEFMSPDFNGWVHLNYHGNFDTTHIGIIRFRKRYFRRYS